MVNEDKENDFGNWSQKKDIPITCETNNTLSLSFRYMFYLSYESRMNPDIESAISQDFLRFNVDEDSKSVSFVVCDGVGQSFLGNIAAKKLGSKLMDWFKNLDKDQDWMKIDETTFEKAWKENYSKLFEEWRSQISEDVNNFILPEHLPSIVKAALDDLRSKHGSESVFVAGHLISIDQEPHLFIFWLGDVRFRLFDNNGNEIEPNNQWTNSERWSSLVGFKKSEQNMPRIKTINLNRNPISRIMVYSDGLASYENELPNLSSKELDKLANDLLLSPSSDDISLIDILFTQDNTRLKEKFEMLPKETADESLDLHLTKSDSNEEILEMKLVNDPIRNDLMHYILNEKAVGSDNWREIYRTNERLTQFSFPLRTNGKSTYQLVSIDNDGNKFYGSEFQFNFGEGVANPTENPDENN